MAGLDADCADDAVEIRLQLRVAELVPGHHHSNLGRVVLGLGGAQIFQRDVVVGPRRVPVRQQVAQPGLGGLGLGQRSLGADDVGLG